MSSNHILLLAHNLPDFSASTQEIELRHYQLYAVEKWLLQRRPCTCLLVYTANPAHAVVLHPQVPASPAVWDSTLAQLTADGARQKQTPHGTLIVTSLAHFRSDYTIVHIPSGNFRDVRHQLYANINLLSIGCSRRTALTLEDPSDSTRRRFLDAYHLPDPSTDYLPDQSSSSLPYQKSKERAAFVTTVLELVKLIQAGLALFGMYPIEHSSSVPSNLLLDGLLCDKTVQGIRTWITQIGGPCVGLESTDRVADPLFVSAILTLVLSIRNKLAYLGYTYVLPRDPFLYPYAFSLALSSYIQSTTPAPLPPPSHHRTFSSPYHAIHTTTPIIPAAPPPTNILSASAAAAAAATIQSQSQPIGAILTRDLIETISAAYSAKLKAENRKVRRVIKNRLAATPSPIPSVGGGGGGVDSDGTPDAGGESTREQRRHTLSLTLSLSGPEGASSERGVPPPPPTQDPGQGTGSSSVGSIGASGGQILSGIGSSLASGLRLGTGGGHGGPGAGGVLGDVMVPTLDLASFTSFGVNGGGTGKKRDKKSRKSKERHAEAAGTGTGAGAGESTDFGAGGSTSASVYGYGYGYERDKDRDTVIAGTLKSLWSGRVAELVRIREEAEGVAYGNESASITTPGLRLSTLGLGHAPTSTSTSSHRPPRRHLHRASDSLSVLSEKDRWRRDKSPAPSPAPGGSTSTVALTRTSHPASDGDGDGSSWRDRRYDGRSTEEESDVFAGSGSRAAGAGATGAPHTFGGMWSGRVRGKLGTWAGLAKRKAQGQGLSVDLGSSTPPLLPPPSTSSSFSKSKERETEPDQATTQNQNENQNRNENQIPPTFPAPPKLIITHGSGNTSLQGSMSSRPSVSRRSTLPASGPQSPTLPPMVFSADGVDDDDDDLLSSGQISPLSDYRPNPFNMLGSNSNFNFTPNGSTTNTTTTAANNANCSNPRTGISPEEYERTLTKLLRQKRPWSDRRVPQSARVASWADPVSASVRSDEEEDGEGEGDEDEEDEGEEDDDEGEGGGGEEEAEDVFLEEDVASVEYTTHPRKRVRGRRPYRSPSPEKRKGKEKEKEKEKDSEVEAEAEGEAEEESDVSRLGVAKLKGKGKAKARFHSLLSVLDGEGVLIEEPLEASEYEDEEQYSEDGFDRESGYRRRTVGFDPRRRRSFHDLDTFRDVEVLSPERMKIDVDLCGHILIMWRREEHLRNVITCTRLITQSLSKTNMALREHYETHLPTLDHISTSTSILSALDTEHNHSLKILQSTNTLEYESAQFLVDELWQTASPSRRKVFALRDKVFNGTGGRRLPAGVRGAHGAFNRLQWTMDGGSRVVDYLGRTESEAEEEGRLEELSAASSGHAGMFMDAPATPIEEGEKKKVEEEEGDLVEHPGIKPVWLLRFFTSWGARWSAATATATGVTSPPATGAQSPASEKEGSSEPEKLLQVPETIPSINRLSQRSEPALMSTDDNRTEVNLPRSASH